MNHTPKILPVDKETRKLLNKLNLGHMYYTPDKVFDEYDFLKGISKLKKKEVKYK